MSFVCHVLQDSRLHNIQMSENSQKNAHLAQVQAEHFLFLHFEKMNRGNGPLRRGRGKSGNLLGKLLDELTASHCSGRELCA